MTERKLQSIADHKRKLFERLNASSNDFSQANFCARFLIKKGWHAQPWERRGSIYQQQTAFVTTVIVSYSRPFTKSVGWPLFPMSITKFSEQEKEMHTRLLRMRHEIFAHSDSRHFKFEPWSVGGFRTTIEQQPFAVISPVDTKTIADMTADLIRVTAVRLAELHSELV